MLINNNYQVRKENNKRFSVTKEIEKSKTYRKCQNGDGMIFDTYNFNI